MSKKKPVEAANEELLAIKRHVAEARSRSEDALARAPEKERRFLNRNTDPVGVAANRCPRCKSEWWPCRCGHVSVTGHEMQLTRDDREKLARADALREREAS